MRYGYLACLAMCLAFSGRATTAPEILDAIRGNNLDALRGMSRQELTDTRGQRDWAPLHYAAF